eukprot:m.22710 g.22710  ORF g.22710 m.22710 type:complete len:74 (-) comp8413_c1_seq1:673-894(-)
MMVKQHCHKPSANPLTPNTSMSFCMSQHTHSAFCDLQQSIAVNSSQIHQGSVEPSNIQLCHDIISLSVENWIN